MANRWVIYATWAIGVGSLAIAISLIFGSEKSHDTLFPRGPFSKLSDRLWYSLAVSGAVLALTGSLTLCIKYSSQAIALLPIAMIGYLTFHITAAFKLRQLYKNKTTSSQLADERQALVWCLVYPYKKVDEHEPRIAIKS